MLKSDMNEVSEDPIGMTYAFGAFRAYVRNVLIKGQVLKQIVLVKSFHNRKTGVDKEQTIRLIPSEAPLLELCAKDLLRVLKKLERY